VESALLSLDGTVVLLYVTPLSEGASYTLSVTGIKDRSRHGNVIAPHAQAQVRYSALAAHWKLDETSGDVAADWSGNGAHAQLRNGAKWSADRQRPGVALASGAFVETGTSLADLEFPFTIALWVNPAATQVEYADIWGNHADGFVGLSLQQDGTRLNQFGFGFGDGAKWQGAGPVSLAADRWQHVAVVCDGASAVVYVDGKEAATRAVQGRFVPNRALPFMLGRGYTAPSRYFTGLLADARIYRRALSAAEVRALAGRMP
jgi:hypothetical protein